ncbi:hypothetical protein ACROYT_G016644 [Oculina patagonica]
MMYLQHATYTKVQQADAIVLFKEIWLPVLKEKWLFHFEALQELRKINGPVCVVSVAGTYRKGKSYVLSRAFDQPPVFPLGHEMLPETVGIWMWILPEKHKDSSGQTFSVVLLDTEGIDSAMGEGLDDNQIFTLTVLLSSVLIFNSQGVPTRRDIEDLEYP